MDAFAKKKCMFMAGDFPSSSGTKIDISSTDSESREFVLMFCKLKSASLNKVSYFN